jgi:hypothetical protein
MLISRAVFEPPRIFASKSRQRYRHCLTPRDSIVRTPDWYADACCNSHFIWSFRARSRSLEAKVGPTDPSVKDGRTRRSEVRMSRVYFPDNISLTTLPHPGLLHILSIVSTNLEKKAKQTCLTAPSLEHGGLIRVRTEQNIRVTPYARVTVRGITVGNWRSRGWKAHLSRAFELFCQSAVCEGLSLNPVSKDCHAVPHTLYYTL